MTRMGFGRRGGHMFYTSVILLAAWRGFMVALLPGGCLFTFPDGFVQIPPLRYIMLVPDRTGRAGAWAL